MLFLQKEEFLVSFPQSYLYFALIIFSQNLITLL